MRKPIRSRRAKAGYVGVKSVGLKVLEAHAVGLREVSEFPDH